MKIVPGNNTSTTQFVFGQEGSLFPHPKTRDNARTSKEITSLPPFLTIRHTENREGGWGKSTRGRKGCDRYESDRRIEKQYSVTFEHGWVSCGCQLIPLRESVQRVTINISIIYLFFSQGDSLINVCIYDTESRQTATKVSHHQTETRPFRNDKVSKYKILNCAVDFLSFSI